MKANIASTLFQAIQTRAAALPAHSFKKGQIIAGNITKLYPNQQAVVKIAGKEMIAQLQAPLTMGRSYWFQVDSTDPYLKLKVAAGHNPTRQSQDIGQLLAHMGLKPTRDRQAVLQALMESGIPMQRKQLAQAMQLTDQIGRKGLDMQAVKEIIRRDLPVTNGIYQAFITRNSQPLKQQLMDVLAEVESFDARTPVGDRLVRRLHQLLLDPQVYGKENSPEKNLLLQTLKGEPITLNKFAEGANFRASEGKYSEDLTRLIKEQLPVDVQSKKQFSQLSDLLIKMQTTSLTKDESTRLNYLIQNLSEKGIFEKVSAYTGLPIASATDKVLSAGLAGTGHIPDTLVRNMAQTAAAQLTPESEAILYEEMQKAESARSVPIDPKIYFLAKLKNHLFQMGLNHEFKALSGIAGNVKNFNEESLKSLLLQINQDANIQGKTVKSEMLIQTLSGMQLSSMQEGQEFLQISMQLPGDRIGVKEDVFLDLESKKNADGEIDPSFCRILFYLQLERLGETVLDMNVSDRAVSLTIYNDKQRNHIFEALRPSLDSALQQLDYKLVSLKVKDAGEEQASQMSAQTHSTRTSFKGVDFRI